MKEQTPVYCDDCPARKICETKDDCHYARTVARWVAEAPPLKDWQIQRLARLLTS